MIPDSRSDPASGLDVGATPKVLPNCVKDRSYGREYSGWSRRRMAVATELASCEHQKYRV